jgi:methylmalonyl-CoA/ethylmalonyl-CoA epimerase
MNNWTIDHVAIVVSDLDKTVELYTKTLGFDQIFRETFPDQGVEVVGIRSGNSDIELLRPLSEDSPIARYRGDAPTKLHHIGYQVPDITKEMARLKSSGMRMIDESPRHGAHGNRVAFIHPKSTAGVLIEVCQRDQ